MADAPVLHILQLTSSAPIFDDGHIRLQTHHQKALIYGISFVSW